MKQPKMQGRTPGKKINPKVLKRIVKMLFEAFPALVPLTVACILFSAAVSSVPAIFSQNVIALIEKWYAGGDWVSASKEIYPKLALLVVLYILSVGSIALFNQLMAYITQGFFVKCAVQCSTVCRIFRLNTLTPTSTAI